MVSAQNSQKLFSRQSIRLYDHDPDGTSAAVVTPDGGTTERWVPMKDFRFFAALAMLSVAAGNGITKMELVANTASDGSGTTGVIKDSGTVAADAVGDNIVLECTAEEIRQAGVTAGVNFTHVAARLTMQNSGDEAVVAYVRADGRFSYEDLTANYIS